MPEKIAQTLVQFNYGVHPGTKTANCRQHPCWTSKLLWVPCMTMGLICIKIHQFGKTETLEKANHCDYVIWWRARRGAVSKWNTVRQESTLAECHTGSNHAVYAVWTRVLHAAPQWFDFVISLQQGKVIPITNFNYFQKVVIDYTAGTASESPYWGI